MSAFQSDMQGDRSQSSGYPSLVFLDKRIPIDADESLIEPLLEKALKELELNSELPLEKNVLHSYITGRAYILDGYYNKAIRAFSDSNRFLVSLGRPESHENFFWLAKSFQGIGQVSKAALNFQKAEEQCTGCSMYVTAEEIDWEFNNLKAGGQDLTFQPIDMSDIDFIISKGSSFRINEFYNPDGTRTGRNELILHANVSEKLVGISPDESEVYSVSWKLMEEVNTGGAFFTVWSASAMNFERINEQFIGSKIGIERKLTEKLMNQIISLNPADFSPRKIRAVVGLENLKI